jgi:8-oxo-dGTP pyrophosphatase MutT (NUDIX family)
LQREIKEEIGDVAEAVKTIPLETFVSTDEKFNFHTYLLVVKQEFIPKLNDEHDGYAWASFSKWPKPLHQGLRNTLQNKTNITKLKTVFEVVDLLEK